MHHGDIAIASGRTFQPDPYLAALALDFLTVPWPFGCEPFGRLRGIRLCGSDIERTWESAPKSADRASA